MQNPVFRFFDLTFALLGLLILSPIFVILYIICFFDTGSPFFRQERVGKDLRPFTLIKFRTMNVDTPSVASHLTSKSAITYAGKFLRHAKLDELPQLWNVLRGDMSLVGPRPCLPHQVELVSARMVTGVYTVRPGITGLAQITGVDMSTPDQLAATDAKMVREFSLNKYFKYIVLTVFGRGFGDRVRLK
jgi:O-antigen biosynthesis protein WbqP